MYDYDKVNPAKAQGKGKKGSLWPWVIAAGAAFGGWWLYDKKKKQAQALERQRQEQLLRQQEEKAGEAPVEGHFSASDRLKGMGIDPTKPTHYQEKGDRYAG